MTNSLWENLYLGSFNEPTDREAFIEKLAKEYHRQCDKYDNNVCTAIDKRGCSMPANGRESALINRNANLVIKSLLEDGLRWSVSKQELMVAIKQYMGVQ